MRGLFLFFNIFWIVATCHAADIRGTAILLDVSRSVSPREFEQIKGIVGQLIDLEHTPNVVQLYVFGNATKKIDRSELQAVQATESFTMFYDAAYDSMQDLKSVNADEKSIIIFSDGKDTKSVTIPEDVVMTAREENIAIHCVGMGRSNKRLLERIAKLTGGKFFQVNEPQLISKIQMALTSKKSAKKIQPESTESVAMETEHQSSAVPGSAIVEKPGSSSYLFWIAGILAVIVIAFFVMKERSKSVDSPTLVLSPEDLQPEPLIEKASVPIAVPSGSQDKKQFDTQEFLTKTQLVEEVPSLVVTKGNNSGQKYKLNKENPVSVGRSRINEVRPDDATISAQHFRIVPENGEYVLYDLGSTNGTMVNNIKVNMAVLEEGDVIRVGSTSLLFTLLD